MISFIIGIGIFLLSTVIFDLLHFFAHYFVKTKYRWIKKIANLHFAHHQFLNHQLTINSSYTKPNFYFHILPEYCTQMFCITLCLHFINISSAIIAYVISTGLFFIVTLRKGVDAHHKAQETVLSEKPGFLRFFVTPQYHCLHHLYPNAYYSSYIKILDYLLGKACGLKNRTITLTGASGEFGQAIEKILQQQSVKKVIPLKYDVDYNATNFFASKEILAETDILILAHGNKSIEHAQNANCDSFVFLIELFKKHYTKKMPLEIWAIGSEIECHPSFGNQILKAYSASKRNFAQQAKNYFYDPTIIYRHIVPSAFRSRMGWGLFSASTVAAISIFLIKRGFRYVPVTYTGIAFLNYFKFVAR